MGSVAGIHVAATIPKRHISHAPALSPPPLFKHTVERLGELLKSGELKDIVAIPTSIRTKEQAESLGIPLVTLDTHSGELFFGFMFLLSRGGTRFACWVRFGSVCCVYFFRSVRQSENVFFYLFFPCIVSWRNCLQLVEVVMRYFTLVQRSEAKELRCRTEAFARFAVSAAVADADFCSSSQVLVYARTR